LPASPAPALAGQNCEARRPTLDSIRRDLALAASVARQLDDMTQRDGTRVVFIGRAGQDLSRYGLRYSHLGIAYRDDAALEGRGAWRVVHKLNECGSSRSTLHRQGLAEFFGDGLYLHEAGVVALKPAIATRIIGQLKDDVACSPPCTNRATTCSPTRGPAPTSRATSGRSKPWRCWSSLRWPTAPRRATGCGARTTGRPPCRSIR
jgi:hypothetical protein